MKIVGPYSLRSFLQTSGLSLRREAKKEASKDISGSEILLFKCMGGRLVETKLKKKNKIITIARKRKENSLLTGVLA